MEKPFQPASICIKVVSKENDLKLRKNFWYHIIILLRKKLIRHLPQINLKSISKIQKWLSTSIFLPTLTRSDKLFAASSIAKLQIKEGDLNWETFLFSTKWRLSDRMSVDQKVFNRISCKFKWPNKISTKNQKSDISKNIVAILKVVNQSPESRHTGQIQLTKCQCLKSNRGHIASVL